MTKPSLQELPITAILNGPNIRTVEEDDELRELAHSLSRQGFLAPIGAVEEAEGVAVLLFGFRRVGAYHFGIKLGLPMPDQVPVMLYPATLPLVEREAIQLIENLERKDLSPVEAYQAIKSLAAKGLTLEDIGERINKTKGTVSKWLSPDKCPPEAREHFLASRLTLGQCYQIATSHEPLAVMRAFLRGETHEAGRRAGRKAVAERSDAPKEKTPRVAVPLPPADESGSLGSVTICGQAGQAIDLVESERLLVKALKLVREGIKDGLSPRSAQAAWKALASAKPLVEAAH